MALDKKCKERQHDSPREEPVYSIEKQPTELPLLSALHLWCSVASSEGEKGIMVANMHVVEHCRVHLE